MSSPESALGRNLDVEKAQILFHFSPNFDITCGSCRGWELPDKLRVELEILYSEKFCSDYIWNVVIKFFPIFCIAGREKAACPLFSLPVAWSLAKCKSSAIWNNAAASQQEGSHGSFCPLCQCLAERRMKSIFSLLFSPFNKIWWEQIKDPIERSQIIFFILFWVTGFQRPLHENLILFFETALISYWGTQLYF